LRAAPVAGDRDGFKLPALDVLEQVGEGPCAFILTVRKESPYKAASKTRWFGKDISWLDTEKLGWRLGFQQ